MLIRSKRYGIDLNLSGMSGIMNQRWNLITITVMKVFGLMVLGLQALRSSLGRRIKRRHMPRTFSLSLCTKAGELGMTCGYCNPHLSLRPDTVNFLHLVFPSHFTVGLEQGQLLLGQSQWHLCVPVRMTELKEPCL